MPFGLCAAIVLAVFSPLLRCQFTYWDDADTIALNPRLNPPTMAAVWFYWTTVGENTPGQLFTPVTYTVWAGAAGTSDLVFGRSPDIDGIRLRPSVFHGTNILLHALAGLLAFGLLHRLFGQRWPALAGSLLFALHPVQVEPVAWASGTKDVLCGLFSIAALWAYISRLPRSSEFAPLVSRARSRLLYGVATTLFLLAMLSKPTALVVPLMAAAIDRLILGRPWRAVVRSLWPWAPLMIPCVLWTRAAQPAPWASPVELWQRPFVAADAVAFYLAKLAWPAHLSVDYGHRPGTVIATGAAYYTWLVPATVLVLILALRWRRDQRPQTEPSGAAAGPVALEHAPHDLASRGGAAGLRVDVPLAAFALFLLPLLPVLGLVPFDFEFYSTVADHYLYLPMLGVAVAAAWAMTRCPTARGLKPAAAIVLVVLAGRSVAQMSAWRDGPTLFQHVRDVNPQSFAACDQLGFAEVVNAARLVGRQADPAPTDPRYPAWRAAQERARAWYFRALDLQPDYVPALTNIAIVDHRLGRGDEQRWALRRVVDLQPRVPPGLRADPVGLAGRLIAAGDPATAVRYLDGIVRADPDNIPAVVLRNRALAMRGK